MKNVTAVCCATLLSVAGLSAQSGTMAKDKDKMMSEAMTMTGCVAQGANGHFMLTNAMKAGEMKGSMPADMKPMTYDLMGGELKAHVGHKVEVTGMMADKMDAGKLGKDKTSTTAVAGETMSGDMHEGITVKSVKMVAATCP
jgi:hypothetical protein